MTSEGQQTYAIRQGRLGGSSSLFLNIKGAGLSERRGVREKISDKKIARRSIWSDTK